MVSLQEADWEYILKEAPPEALEPQALESAPPGLESADHDQIDKLIVSRAFARGKPARKRRRRSLTSNEILMVSLGSVFALLILSLLIFLMQM